MHERPVRTGAGDLLDVRQHGIVLLKRVGPPGAID